MRKPTICICENKGADQLRSNTAKLISAFVFARPLLSKLCDRNFQPLAISCACKLDLCQTWSKTKIVGFLMRRHILSDVCLLLLLPLLLLLLLLLLFKKSILRAFRDKFNSYETDQSVVGTKKGDRLTHPQTELGLSYMFPVWGSNPLPGPHQIQR